MRYRNFRTYINKRILIDYIKYDSKALGHYLQATTIRRLSDGEYIGMQRVNLYTDCFPPQSYKALLTVGNIVHLQGICDIAHDGKFIKNAHGHIPTCRECPDIVIDDVSIPSSHVDIVISFSFANSKFYTCNE